MNSNILMHAIAGVNSTLNEQSAMNKQASQVMELQKQAEVMQMSAIINSRVAEMEKQAFGVPAWLSNAYNSAAQYAATNPYKALAGIGALGGAGIGALAGGEGNRLMGAGLGALGGAGLGAGLAYGEVPLRMYTAPKGAIF